MFDIALRPLKDDLFNPLSRSVSKFITPLHITLAALVFGLISVYSTFSGRRATALLFWALNRALDCLDGAVARQRNQQSDVGGFLDLLCDFIVYSLVPIGAALGSFRGGRPGPLFDDHPTQGGWMSIMVGHAVAGHRDGLRLAGDLLAVSLLEAVCWLNNFVLFYIAAVVEKANARGEVNVDKKATTRRRRELTSLAMRPALIEGTESAIFFTLMLAFPGQVRPLSYLMSLGVAFGTGQRVAWLVNVLGKDDRRDARGADGTSCK